MNLILTGQILQNLERAEEIIDRYLTQAGVDPEEVKQRGPVERGTGANGVSYSFRQQGLFSTIIRIGWVTDLDDEELGARGYLMIETACCFTPTDPKTLRLVLEYNHALRSPVRVAALAQGKFLGTDLTTDISSVTRQELEKLIHAGFAVPGQFFNQLTTWDPTVEPLGVTLQRLRESSGGSH